jgi:hypothetical protein
MGGTMTRSNATHQPERGQAVDGYLVDLMVQVTPELDEQDQLVAAHLAQTFRNRWRGLFTGYDVEGLPRTNNELETYLRCIKTGLGYRR